jgi:hypothetical protein
MVSPAPPAGPETPGTSPSAAPIDHDKDLHDKDLHDKDLHGKNLRLAGMVTGGAGVVSFVVAAIFGGQAKDAAKNVEKTAGNGGTYDPTEDQRGRSAQTREITFVVVGTAALVAGGVIYYLGASHPSEGGAGSRGRGAAGDVLMRARSWWQSEGMLLITAVVLGTAGAACTYSPDFANDNLICGPEQSCPKGYSCAPDNKCWKIGETPGGSGGTDGGTPHADASIDVPSTDPRQGFLGTWTFSGGTLDATCSDGSVVHRNLTSDYIVMNLGTAAATVLAQYYCDTGWTMQLSGGNTMAVATSNQSCVEITTDSTVSPAVTTTYTWSALAFAFTKTSALAATSTGHFMGSFSASDGTNGTCDVMFTGPMTKN